MSSNKTLIALMTLLVSGCANQATTPKTEYIYVDSSCSAFKPITVHGNDPDVMDARTVRSINTHNDTYDKLCGDKSNVQSN